MKKWQNIIYLDSDIIIRHSLNDLTKINNFAAIPENGNKSLRKQFVINPPTKKGQEKLETLKQDYNLQGTSFYTGVMCFPTSIIQKNTFNDINKLLIFFAPISKYGDQGILNLFLSKMGELTYEV